jgi:hypothetical protein
MRSWLVEGQMQFSINQNRTSSSGPSALRSRRAWRMTEMMRDNHLLRRIGAPIDQRKQGRRDHAAETRDPDTGVKLISRNLTDRLPWLKP